MIASLNSILGDKAISCLLKKKKDITIVNKSIKYTLLFLLYKNLIFKHQNHDVGDFFLIFLLVDERLQYSILQNFALSDEAEVW